MLHFSFKLIKLAGYFMENHGSVLIKLFYWEAKGSLYHNKRFAKFLMKTDGSVFEAIFLDPGVLDTISRSHKFICVVSMFSMST